MIIKFGIFLILLASLSCKKDVDIKYYKGMVRAQLLLKMKEYDQALMISNKVLEEVPEYDLALFVKAKALYLTGRFAQAQESFNSLIAVNSEYPDAHFLLGNVEGQLGKYDKAIAHYNQELSFLNGDSTLDKQKSIYLQIGRAQTEIGNSEEALAAFNSVISIDSTFADVYNDVGQLKEDQGDLEGALRSRQKALALNPDGDYQYQIGVLLVNLARYEEAVPYLEKAKMKHSNFPGIYYNLGRSLVALNMAEQGNSYLAKADSLQNRNAELAEAKNRAEIDGSVKNWLKYAQMLHEDKRYQESFYIVRKLLAENPENEEVKEFIEKAGTGK